MTFSTVVVLGMHRSGTSCLTGSLEEAGLALGNVDRKRHTNPKGNRESLSIMDLNNAVLIANGATWDTPPAGVCDWSTEQLEWRDRLIAEYAEYPLWGFKDPRTLLVLEGWLQGLPAPQLVGTFRHPLAVAQSLQTRNGFEIEKGINLWTAYNQRLLRVMESHPVPLLCFDWTAECYNAVLRGLAVRLGLTPPETPFSFFETHLRRNTSQPDAPLPAAAQDIYQQLLQRSRDLLADLGVDPAFSVG
ncbi:sulfotransferase family protein [Pseudotabrizicola alkalilacus]|nr:sulfotransferase family protein [Pseudotabrizicola alkalilacus]